MESKNTLKRSMTILIGLVALCVSAGAAKAQSYKGKFTLTTPVKWDQAWLPAGDYSFSLTSSPGGQKYGIVRSESSNLAVMVLPRTAASQESQGGSELRIQEV